MSIPNFSSLCAMHRATCERLGPLPALRFRVAGMWRHITWAEYRREADCGAAGLAELGVQPGDRVAVLSENRFEFLVSDHAILSAGAVPVPIYPSSSPSQIQYLIDHSGARAVIVSGAAQLAKVASVLSSLPDLRLIVTFDPVDTVLGVPVHSWDAVRMAGFRGGDRAMNEVRRRESALNGDSFATIIYTSGTTGVPKGVVLTHGGFLFTTASVAEVLNFNSTHIMASWLPYGHVFARCVDHYTTTRMGMTLALAESALTVMDIVAEIQPHYLTSVPRLIEKAWLQIAAVPVEERAREAVKIFGSRLNFLTSGGAPLPRAVGQGLCDAGVPIREGYGMTETSSIVSFNPRDGWKIGTVGLAVPGIEIRIASDGEVLTKGPHLMQGYWRNPEATAETIVDGWLHTGDLGKIDEDGHLQITGRKKDLIITSSGKNISPAGLEALLLSDPFVEQAVTYGDGRHFITALLVPNMARLTEAAHAAGTEPPTEGDVITDPRLVTWFQKRVDNIMNAVSQPERVKKIVLLNRPLSLDREELTSTSKVRRAAVFKHFQKELEALYEGGPS